MDNKNSQEEKYEEKFREEISKKELRKMMAKKDKGASIWYGLGLFGIVGWSVAIPTLIGILVGVLIDTHYETGYSWTLMLFIAGLALGCLNAWYWVNKERKEIEKIIKRKRRNEE